MTFPDKASEGGWCIGGAEFGHEALYILFHLTCCFLYFWIEQLWLQWARFQHLWWIWIIKLMENTLWREGVLHIFSPAGNVLSAPCWPKLDVSSSCKPLNVWRSYSVSSEIFLWHMRIEFRVCSQIVLKGSRLFSGDSSVTSLSSASAVVERVRKL